ncbi:MAG TPA: zinc-binding dehydrogenase, partial [Acidimicrobiales bacterium]|nr:zinc-binding dehydrogenase [Acidimicrobiales bacterium]
LEVGDSLSSGADLVIDCVGSQASIAADLLLTRSGGTVVLVGMPGQVLVDLTSLWHRQINLRGSYAYGVEDGAAGGRPERPGAKGRRTFDLAFDLVAHAGLERLVSASYPLDRYRDAIDHAANAGPRGAVKIVFDVRGEKHR